MNMDATMFELINAFNVFVAIDVWCCAVNWQGYLWLRWLRTRDDQHYCVCTEGMQIPDQHHPHFVWDR